MLVVFKYGMAGYKPDRGPRVLLSRVCTQRRRTMRATCRAQTARESKAAFR